MQRSSGRSGLLFCLALVTGGCASPGTLARPAPFPGPLPSPTAAAAVPTAAAPAVVTAALTLRGTPYRPGGEDPETGLDCSGLVRYVYGQVGVELPRTVAEQARIGARIPRDDVRAGDLLFFSTTGPGATHVGIALGVESPGEFVHAPGSGRAVRIDRLDMPYWRSRLVAVKRVF